MIVSDENYIAILTGVHNAVVILQIMNCINQLFLCLNDWLAFLKCLLFRKLHNLLPKKIYSHSLVAILVLLNQLKHKSLLFQTSITFDSSSLEDLTNLLLMINFHSLVR